MLDVFYFYWLGRYNRRNYSHTNGIGKGTRDCPLAGKIRLTPVETSAGDFFVVLSLLVLARRGSISKTTNMIAKLKNILRCYAVGMGIKERANTFHLSRNTVRKYVRLFISSGKTTEQLLELSDARSSVTASRRNASWNWTR